MLVVNVVSFHQARPGFAFHCAFAPLREKRLDDFASRQDAKAAKLRKEMAPFPTSRDSVGALHIHGYLRRPNSCCNQLFALRPSAIRDPFLS
jgi:hypothetical protein